MLEENKTKKPALVLHACIFSPHILECPLHGRSHPKILVTIALIMGIFLSASYRNGKPEREVVCMTLQRGQCKARRGHYDENAVLSFASFCWWAHFCVPLSIHPHSSFKGCAGMFWKHSTCFYFLLSNVGRFANVLFVTNFISSILISIVCLCGRILTKFQIVFWGFSEV